MNNTKEALCDISLADFQNRIISTRMDHSKGALDELQFVVDRDAENGCYNAFCIKECEYVDFHELGTLELIELATSLEVASNELSRVVKQRLAGVMELTLGDKDEAIK